jgi:hypothetical protein
MMDRYRRSINNSTVTVDDFSNAAIREFQGAQDDGESAGDAKTPETTKVPMKSTCNTPSAK